MGNCVFSRVSHVKSNFDLLPELLLGYMLGWVELAKLRCVCRRFRDCVVECTKLMVPKGMTVHMFEKMKLGICCRKVIELSVSEYFRGAEEAVNGFVNLRCLEIRDYIRYANMTNGIDGLVKRLEILKFNNVGFCDDMKFEGFENLKELHMWRCSSISWDIMKTIGKDLRKLEVLSLREPKMCGKISWLNGGCIALRELDLTGSRRIHLDELILSGLGDAGWLRRLKVLRAFGCGKKDKLVVVGKLMGLEVLEVERWGKLNGGERWLENLVELRVLKVKGFELENVKGMLWVKEMVVVNRAFGPLVKFDFSGVKKLELVKCNIVGGVGGWEGIFGCCELEELRLIRCEGEGMMELRLEWLVRKFERLREVCVEGNIVMRNFCYGFLCFDVLNRRERDFVYAKIETLRVVRMNGRAYVEGKDMNGIGMG